MYQRDLHEHTCGCLGSYSGASSRPGFRRVDIGSSVVAFHTHTPHPSGSGGVLFRARNVGRAPKNGWRRHKRVIVARLGLVVRVIRSLDGARGNVAVLLGGLFWPEGI